MWVVEGCNCLEGLKLEGPPLSTPSGAGKKSSWWQHAGSVVPGVAREGVALQGQFGAAPAAASCHQAGTGRHVGRLLAQPTKLPSSACSLVVVLYRPLYRPLYRRSSSS